MLCSETWFHFRESPQSASVEPFYPGSNTALLCRFQSTTSHVASERLVLIIAIVKNLWNTSDPQMFENCKNVSKCVALQSSSFRFISLGAVPLEDRKKIQCAAVAVGPTLLLQYWPAPKVVASQSTWHTHTDTKQNALPKHWIPAAPMCPWGNHHLNRNYRAGETQLVMRVARTKASPQQCCQHYWKGTTKRAVLRPLRGPVAE